MPDRRDSKPVPEAPKRPPSDRPSGQAPGEEVVQVNDPYSGDGPPPDSEPFRDDAQHPTGG